MSPAIKTDIGIHKWGWFVEKPMIVIPPDIIVAVLTLMFFSIGYTLMANPYSSFTFTFFAFCRLSFGRWTVKMPFLKVARALPGSTSSGRITERENLPQ